MLLRCEWWTMSGLFITTVILSWLIGLTQGKMPMDKVIIVLQHHGSELDAGTTDHLVDTNFTRENIPVAVHDALVILRRSSKKCNESERYRRVDGTCNNLQSPLKGASLHIQRRLLKNAYDDKKGIPRIKSLRGNKFLPSARHISLQCFPPADERKPFLDTNTSQMFMQWGQYIDHDLVFTELANGMACCSNLDQDGFHEDTRNGGPCFPIPIDPDTDRHFNVSCMGFRRSYGVYRHGIREQINVATSFVDASTVYGSSEAALYNVRSFSNGTLMVSPPDMLPLQGTQKCILHSLSRCPYAGDSRVSVFPGLTALHLLFLREHNRIASELAKVNPHWDDERLFQESRKIIIAFHQKIMYEEYLPILLGKDAMNAFNISAEHDYQPELNPGISNVFAAAAFRYGHSQINSQLYLHKLGMQNISDLYFRPDFVYDGQENTLRNIFMYQTKHCAQKADHFFTKEVTDMLFHGVDSPGESFDLAARNIQRARDHGLPPYLDYVDWSIDTIGTKLGVPRINLPQCLSNGVYESVKDIDIFLGAMHEEHLDEACVGPTFATIIAEQMHVLKHGDRAFYTTKDRVLGFTPDQLRSIQQTGLTSLICRNTETYKMQPDCMRPPRRIGNHYRLCSTYPDLNFPLWKD